MQGATRRGRNGKPNPLRVAAHVVTHIQSLPGMLGALRAPSSQSFAHGLFNGLNAYFLVDGEGRRRAFRYRWIPSEDGAALSAEQERTYPPSTSSANCNRLAQAPVSWKLMFQMAEPGDPTHDVTKVWPSSRRQITAGRLVIERPHEDDELADSLMFDPTESRRVSSCPTTRSCTSAARPTRSRAGDGRGSRDRRSGRGSATGPLYAVLTRQIRGAAQRLQTTQ